MLFSFFEKTVFVGCLTFCTNMVRWFATDVLGRFSHTIEKEMPENYTFPPKLPQDVLC